VGDPRIDRFHPVNTASFRGDQGKRNRTEGRLNLVVTLGDKPRLQSPEAAVVTMVDGPGMFGRVIDDMPMHDGLSSGRLVSMLCGQHCRRQRCGD
jgi:hypothetical protein